MDAKSRVTGTRSLGAGKFVTLNALDWVDEKGRERTWESADRVGGVSAVLIVPWLRPTNRLVMIRQYRPPARALTLEFPAGICEPGETPEESAARELREETGLVAKRLRVWPAAFTTPGLSSESVYMILADVDEADEENQHPVTDFDPGEDIVTFYVFRDDVPDFIRSQIEEGVSLDAKLAAYVLGLVNPRHFDLPVTR